MTRIVTMFVLGAFFLPRIVFAAAGDLDPSFGGDGSVTTDFGAFDVAAALVVQPDGKLVAAGRADSGGPNFGLARYNADGSLDTSFGTGGMVTTDFSGFDTVSGLALQTDGKIVAAGGGAPGSSVVLARYNTDGTLDGGFGTSGLVITSIGGSSDMANAVVIQPDGKIVIAGHAVIGGFADFALARYNTDGTLDGGFGTSGLVTTDFSGSDDTAEALVVQSDGKLVAAGQAVISSFGEFALARYNGDGTLDSSFGSGGLVTTPISASDHDRAEALVLQPDGRLVAAGVGGFEILTFFALTRYNTDGTLDSTFGSSGIVTTNFSGDREAAMGLVLQPDGKLVAAGQAQSPSIFTDTALARYHSDGTLDSTFGSGGLVTTDVPPGGSDGAFAIVLQADGKLVTAGVQGADFSLVRYLGTTAANVPAVSASGLVVMGALLGLAAMLVLRSEAAAS